MYLLSLPGGHKPRRKSTSDLFKGMNVSKALAILKISEREYLELSDLEFREANSAILILNEHPRGLHSKNINQIKSQDQAQKAPEPEEVQ